MKNNTIKLQSYVKGFVYFHPEVIRMLLLGFSAGLPYLLVMGTFSWLLKDAGISRTDIGFASWIGLAYSIKVVWSPLVDNLKIPLLHRWFGKRRSWLFVAQVGIAFCLLAIAVTDAGTHTARIIGFALATAFLAATQDIVVDAFRVESVDEKKQGAASAMYIMGYRLAMIAAGAGALMLANEEVGGSWEYSYMVMALLMSVGLIGWLLSPEPPHVEREVGTSELDHKVTNHLLQAVPTTQQKLRSFIQTSSISQHIIRAIISPFVDFIIRYRWWGLVIIAFIMAFRVSDLVMGVMTNVFYDDMGFSKYEVAKISKIYGLIMTILGAFIGGIAVNRVNILKCLFTGSLLVMLTNLLFAYMATQPKSNELLIGVISIDNLAGGFAQGVLMAYFATLVNKEFTATQYALYTSLMTLVGKILGGFSGADIDRWGYEFFFIYTTFLGIPAVLLVMALMYREKKTQEKGY